MAKATKNSTKLMQAPSRDFEMCFDIFTLKERPISLAYIENLGLKFLKWSIEDDDALKVMPFFRQHGHCSNDIDRWIERSPNFARAYTTAKQAIGDRRETGALKRKYDAGLVATSMPLYDREWKNNAEWKANLTKEREQPTTKIVVIEKFGSLDGNDK